MSSSLTPVVFNFTQPQNQPSVEALVSITSNFIGGPVNGTFSWNAAGTQLTFTPTAPGYPPADTIDADLAAGYTSLNGVCVGDAVNLSFFSGCNDNFVRSNDPAEADIVTGLPGPITISFNQPMDQGSAVVTVVSDVAGPLTGTLTWNGISTTATFTLDPVALPLGNVTVTLAAGSQNATLECTYDEFSFAFVSCDEVINILNEGLTFPSNVNVQEMGTCEVPLISFLAPVDEASVENGGLVFVSDQLGVINGTWTWLIPNERVTFTPDDPGNGQCWGNDAQVTYTIDNILDVNGVCYSDAYQHTFDVCPTDLVVNTVPADGGDVGEFGAITINFIGTMVPNTVTDNMVVTSALNGVLAHGFVWNATNDQLQVGAIWSPGDTITLTFPGPGVYFTQFFRCDGQQEEWTFNIVP